jgi:hypothetical protein
MAMKRKRRSILLVVVMLLGSIGLAACGRSEIAEPTATPTTAVEVSSPDPTSTPGPEPQIVLLRGAPGCDRTADLIADSPIQLHYGVWGSLDQAHAEASWPLIDVTLVIDGEEVHGDKQPVAADLVDGCGSSAEGIYWLYYVADLEGLPAGDHQVEVTYVASGEIDDGSGQIREPGIILENEFTLAAGPSSDDVDEPHVLAAPDVERFPDNPIIVPEMLPGDDGADINGPSLIRVPSWIENPLGRYYLYFAHHIGDYIRLAYADDLAGPWTVYDPGTLHLEDTICKDVYGSIYADYKHMASPDVHVDDETQQIRMYFHCPVYLSGPVEEASSYLQVTLVATSSDGLNFEASSEPLGTSYFRVFEWDGLTYALGMPGVFYRSVDGLSDFQEGPTLFSENMRHSAVLIRDGRLLVFYSDVGDTPERILLTEIDLDPDWMAWSTADPVVVLEPEYDWEGANLPLEPSVRGNSDVPVRQLRDPAIFIEGGHIYLLYSVAGEMGIAIAEIYW